MLVFVTLPGMKKEPIIVSDAANLAEFCREVFNKTGCNLFNGFGFKNINDGTTYTVPTASVVTKDAILDLGPAGAGTSNVSLANTAYTTTVKTTIFAEGDEIVILDILSKVNGG
jgi:hypothetical protein